MSLGVNPGGWQWGATDECSENFNCCGVIPGGLEVQGLGEGPPGTLTGGAAEQSMLDTQSRLLGAITTGCMRPFVPRTIKMR